MYTLLEVSQSYSIQNLCALWMVFRSSLIGLVLIIQVSIEIRTFLRPKEIHQ